MREEVSEKIKEKQRAREGGTGDIISGRRNADRRRGDHTARAQEALREVGDSHRGPGREQATG